MWRLFKYLFLILVLSSCGAGYHLKQAKRHLMIAESKGAKISRDTVFKDIKIKVPGIKIQWEPKIITLNDTVYYETVIPGAEKPAKLKIIYRRDPTTGKTTAQPSLIMPDKKVEAKAPIIVNETITAKKGISWQSVALYIIIAFIGGVIFDRFFVPVIVKLLVKV